METCFKLIERQYDEKLGGFGKSYSNKQKNQTTTNKHKR